MESLNFRQVQFSEVPISDAYTKIDLCRGRLGLEKEQSHSTTGSPGSNPTYSSSFVAIKDCRAWKHIRKRKNSEAWKHVKKKEEDYCTSTHLKWNWRDRKKSKKNNFNHLLSET